MVSRDGKMPSSVRVECPNCGNLSPVSLQYMEGTTSDYQGVCKVRLEDCDNCGASLLLTVNIPEGLTSEGAS